MPQVLVVLIPVVRFPVALAVSFKASDHCRAAHVSRNQRCGYCHFNAVLANLEVVALAGVQGVEVVAESETGVELDLPAGGMVVEVLVPRLIVDKVDYVL
jgi:hypothetical protein